jgi:hypothetical protein
MRKSTPAFLRLLIVLYEFDMVNSSVILEAIRDGRRIRGVGRSSTKVSAATGRKFFINHPSPDASFDHHEFSMTKNRRCEDASGG